MSSVESFLLAYVLNSLWQVPLLFASAWIVARAARATGPALEQRIWVSALLLQALLPACSISPFAWLRELWNHRAGLPGKQQVSVAIGPGVGAGALHLPAHLQSTVVTIYLVTTIYFLARLLWRGSRLSKLRRRSRPLLLTGEAALCWSRCCDRFGVHHATLAAASQLFGPVTLGIRRKLVLLPSRMVTDLPIEDLRTVIAHEFAHMHRQDFAKNLLYEVLALPVSYHPLFWLTREHVLESREMVCDRMAAEISGRKEYAHSLLRLASLLLGGASATTSHAIGIFDANKFERRLMKLTEKQEEIRGVRRVATITACLVFGVATCCSALALHVHVGADSRSNAKASSASPSRLKVDSGTLAGALLTHVNPIYPEAAKKAKIQGPVVLHAVVGKDGSVQNLTVVSGPPELQPSTLDAVRQWTYKPFLLNGDPVEVETTVTVTYSLQP